ncbi:Bug family tripartite tricarboxylate transporter substrate binding protein [Roseomonas populi]|uniref:Tripartite tricarboxylate transporter substrate binding protein n=1 Tax=Roseomonas populi TaxID=3121582 RepID=A0ABT1X8X6_9PROT|nr:tripartite tricarboxylate transporter substrate binding protein [Roseomonas pecuniae]MCR0983853.1 tripartite tricarboxylate transporter substrate binding protein [Roseomonas pecuniae]
MAEETRGCGPVVTRRATLGGAAAATLLAGGARAQRGYPERSVRIIVPWAPGGAVDTTARRIAQRLSEGTGQAFVVENRSGATGTIGTAEAARQAPDGYNLLAIDNTYAVMPYVFRQLPFDHANGFELVTVMTFTPTILAVGAKSPYRTLGEVIAAAKKDPEKLTYGTGGIGSSLHFGMEAFQQAAGMKLLHVPFRGGGDADTACVSGQVDMVLTSLSSGVGNVKGGLMRAIAFSGSERATELPDVPTFAQAGLPGFGVVNWSGLAAPKGTPKPVIDKLYEETAAALRDPGVVSFMQGTGSIPGGMQPAAFRQLLQEESERWRVVAEKANVEKQ